MTTAEIARILEERNQLPENLELGAKLEFLSARGVGGMRLQGAVIAISRRVQDCLQMIEFGDSMGWLGRGARKKSVEKLIDAEARARRLADELIRKNRLEQAWERYRREADTEIVRLLRQGGAPDAVALRS